MPKDPRLYVGEQRDLKRIITLAVGEEEEEFHVYEDLLCKHSVFFESATKKEWKEGQERRVKLPDDTPSVVNLYAQWLYSDRILSRQPPGQDDKNMTELQLLIKAFIFGEKIQDGDFKDASIDALIHLVETPDKDGKKWYPAHLVDCVYEGTPEKSPLLKLLGDMHTFPGSSKWLENQGNVEFLRDIAGRLLDGRKEPARQDPTLPRFSTIITAPTRIVMLSVVRSVQQARDEKMVQSKAIGLSKIGWEGMWFSGKS